MSSSEILWASLSLGAIVIVAVLALVFVLVSHRKQRDATVEDETGLLPVDPDAPGEVWVVANPTKPSDYDALRIQIHAEVVRATGRPARWIETTVEDPGTGQTIEALRHKPALVIAAGGDGTVRAVAAGMAHSRVPMALLPIGTGNLLARNLGLPLSPKGAIRVALTPVSRRVDLAWLSVDRVQVKSELPAEGRLLKQAQAEDVRALPEGVREPAETEYAYLVIAGVGFDGETMANTTPELKKKVGWSAYVLTALSALRIERMKATVTVLRTEDDPINGTPDLFHAIPIPQSVRDAVRASSVLAAPTGPSTGTDTTSEFDMTALRARTVLFANCGELPFAQLAPSALIDDGQLDVIAIDTQVGLLGWAYLSVKIFGNQAGLHPINVKNDLAKIQFRQTPAARVDISKPYPVQVDGDPVGTARTVTSRSDKDALLVRVPSGTPGAIPEWDRRI